MQKKKRFQSLVYVVLFALMLQIVLPMSQNKGYAESSAEGVIELYETGNLIGTYSSLQDIWKVMTDSDGDYKIILGNSQRDFVLTGEIVLPKVHRITFVGTPYVDQYGINSTSTIYIDDTLTMQSDIVFKNCSLYQKNAEKITYLNLQQYDLSINGEYSKIKDDSSEKREHLFAIKGDTGSSMTLENVSIEIRGDIHIDSVIWKGNAELDIYSGVAEIAYMRIVHKTKSNEMSYHARSNLPVEYSIGTIDMHDDLWINLDGVPHIIIGKINAYEEDEWIPVLSLDYANYSAMGDNYFHCWIKEGNGFTMTYNYSIRDKDMVKRVRNEISALRLPKEYSIENIEHKCTFNYNYNNLVSMTKDVEGNVWLEPIEDTAESEELCNTLNEESKDDQGIYYTLYDDTGLATVGLDNDYEGNSFCNVSDVTIPSKVEKNGKEYIVTRIGQNSFKKCSVTKCVIADTVESIGANAFSGSSLQELKLGSGVRELGKMALYNERLYSIQVDKKNPYFRTQDGVLFDADLHTLIRYPSYWGIWDCKQNYTVPETVTTITGGAFAYNGLYSVSADSVTEIGEHAFQADGVLDFSYFTSFSGKKLQKIGDYAFYSCRSLENIDLGDRLRIVGRSAFDRCKTLTAVLLPDSVEILGKDAFAYCSGLQYFLGATHTQYIDGTFVQCEQLKVVQLSDAPTKLADGMFCACSRLEKIYLPSNYMEYEEKSFWWDYEQRTAYGLPEQEDYITKEHLQFADLTGHMHTMVTETARESTEMIQGIEVTYCAECHFVSEAKYLATKEPVATPTPAPTANPTITPVPSVTATPTPATTATPYPAATASPTAAPTVTATPKPTDSSSSSGGSGGGSGGSGGSSGGGGGGGTTTPTEVPTETPAITATPRPTVQPTPAVEPTEMPNVTPTVTPSADVQPVNTPKPTDSANTDNHKYYQNLQMKVLTIQLNRNNEPVLSWKKNGKAFGYIVYRSLKRNQGYLPVYTVKNKKVVHFTDRKTVSGKRYYYRIRAFCIEKKTRYYGAFSKTGAVSTLPLKTPVIRAMAGKTVDRVSYIQIALKRYSGSQVAIYLKNGKSYQRLKLLSSSIQKYHGIFRIRCSNRRRTYYLRVKTITKRNGRRYYSRYSNVVKVRVTG